MNAPVAEIQLAEGKLELLPLTSIAPSETPAQARRRKRYNAEALAELAASIRAVGVMQPVVVRKLTALRGIADYELIAGERRWLASEKAGVAHVPTIIREDITDADLLALQYIENKQRETIDPLQEAETFRDLMEGENAKSAEDLVDLLGVSRAHIYNRRKLLNLQPAVLDALEAGRIDHTKALQIARLPAAKLQRKALEIAVESDHRGNPISHREFAERLRERLMVRLDGAPFDLDSAAMLSHKPGQFACQEQGSHNLPGCTSCPNSSATDESFQAEVNGAYGAGAIVCTDKPCHDYKVLFLFNAKLIRAREEGRTIIEGDEAKAIKPYQHADLRGYIDLDEPAAEMDPPADLPDAEYQRWSAPTYRALLKNHEVIDKHSILVDPFNSQPREVLPVTLAAKPLKKLAGIELRAAEQNDRAPASLGLDDAPASTTDHEEVRRQDEKRKARELLERVFRRKLLDQVREKFKGPLKREDLHAIADRWLSEHDTMDLPLYDWYYGGRINTDKMTERELLRLLLELGLWSTTEYLGESPTGLLTIAKRLKIDQAKVRKAAKAEVGGEPEAEEKPVPKKKGKKK